MKKLNVLVLSVVALLSACSSDESLNSETSCPITMDTRSQKIVVQTNSSAWNILHEMIGKGENNLLSPLSLSTCLAILNNGAKGDTDVQIRDFLGLEGFDPTETNNVFKNILGSLPNVDSSVKLAIANSFWYKNSLKLAPVFGNVLSDFDTELYNVDFSDKNTVSGINSWCKQKTNGLIPKFIDNIDPASVAVLLNALYYKAEWTDRFNESLTSKDLFHGSNDIESQVEFMHRHSDETGFDNECISMVCLPMGKFKMFETFFILPKDGISLSEAAAAAQKALNERKTDGWKTYFVDMNIPKFTLKTNQSLRDILESMGHDIFGGDFSKMFRDSGASFSDIRQACSFSVDEKEVEAAAVTGTNMDFINSRPVSPFKMELNLNRPFLFGLQETSSNTLLFLGVIQNL